MKQLKVFLIMIFLVLLSPLLAQENTFLDEIEKYREEQNAEFLNPDKSPLTPEQRTEFTGHSFFEADAAYRVNARFEPTPNDRPFPLGTSKGGTQLYKRIGILHFVLKGEPYTLEAYLQVQRFRIPNQKPIVFLPLVDATTGTSTYGGGRYLHYEGVPEGEEWIIDFNKLYNPYCAYSDRYECPMVPEPNHLPIPVEAGIKGS
ncbi:DUF1684 domain-containing protein [Roseivirga sp. E12]|uniref:DUF1684 domain-containing protein n=1 Tax=Roseivirga sp. E12 TaxID=2819237 RepID=UPI001ABCFBDA|nr:DUF1684 domain-containing protein [Roseivirga sp. E12]MBO3698610.1 DUF1684 domain-containing protein [Roseivirga sp. E12]